MGLCLHAHRAQLDHLEIAATLADPPLAVEHRPTSESLMATANRAIGGAAATSATLPIAKSKSRFEIVGVRRWRDASGTGTRRH